MGAKASGKAKGSLKVGGSLKLGGKASAKGSAKGSAKAKSSADLSGSCPKAGLMKMKASSKPQEYIVKTICSDLKTTCCDASSMQNVQKNWKNWTASVAKIFGTISVLPKFLNILFNNMDEKTQCSAM